MLVSGCFLPNCCLSSLSDNTLSHLGNALSNLNDLENAQQLLLRALQINKDFFGEKHPLLCPILTDLGNCFLALENHSQAENYLLSALTINESFYGKNHLSARLTLTSLGDLYYQMKELEKALDYQSRAYQISEVNLGESHKHTIEAINEIIKITEHIPPTEVRSENKFA